MAKGPRRPTSLDRQLLTLVAFGCALCVFGGLVAFNNTGIVAAAGMVNLVSGGFLLGTAAVADRVRAVIGLDADAEFPAEAMRSRPGHVRRFARALKEYDQLIAIGTLFVTVITLLFK